jgi:hypothetical protein
LTMGSTSDGEAGFCFGGTDELEDLVDVSEGSRTR